MRLVLITQVIIIAHPLDCLDCLDCMNWLNCIDCLNLFRVVTRTELCPA